MTSLFALTAATPGLPCRTTDPEIFFSKSSTDREYAKGLCADCPIRTPCAQYALDNRDVQGVWGGTTAADRRAFRTNEPCRHDEQGRLRRLCGSEQAYRAHFKFHETPGEACVDGDCVAAHEEFITRERRARLEQEHAKGGTGAGYFLHRRLGEQPCDACREGLSAERACRPRSTSPGQGRDRSARVDSGAADHVNGPETGVQPLALAG
jgi:hypothetical protein